MIQTNKEFTTWLQTLGFAANTIKNFPAYVSEMLNWLEQKGIKQSSEITEENVKAFFIQWKHRKNKRTGAGLSQNHINTGITAINNFIKFLHKTGKINTGFKLERQQTANPRMPQVLTKAEIHALYQASHTISKRVNTAAFGQRDRAMLAVFYGCGLRKSEGGSLQVSDVLAAKNLLFVRKGKGNKERFVPVAEKNMQDIEEYLQYGRPWFLEQREKRQKQTDNKNNALFINIEGNPMKSFTERIKALKEEAQLNKTISLHTLRHSIATHLLQSGMDMEQIRKFLGHASLESTQIYTHILK